MALGLSHFEVSIDHNSLSYVSYTFDVIVLWEDEDNLSCQAELIL